MQPTRATGGAAARSRPRAQGINGRAITLAALVIGCVLLLVIPMTNYLQQRSEVQQLQDQIAAKQAEISQLQHKAQQLEDPAYVKAQARERLNYILPGEMLYVVANNSPDSDTVQQKQSAADAAQQESTTALQDLASSIAEADNE